MTGAKQPAPAGEPVFPVPGPEITESELKLISDLVALSKSVRLEQRTRWHNGILAFDRLVRKLRRNARSNSGTTK